MMITRTNLTPGMIVLLVLLGILFAVVIVPLIIIAGFCWLICQAVTGRSPLELYLRSKARRHDRIFERPCQDPPGNDDRMPPSADDTIECEVISSRTFDEDGKEIR